MTKSTAKLAAAPPAAAKSASWGDYDPHFSARKATTGTHVVPTAATLDRNNSPYFPRLSGTSQT
ncbi:hypothetical protein [Methylorubrum thiocyanatum]|uniref:hypothetical protein n=1 Tax=Methylorubrum thiocyanatum TaxID=47958 RepID=UPI003654F441